MNNHSKDLWVNPRRNMRGTDGNRAWDNKGNISSSTGTRFLELADIALGLKEPAPKKKKTAADAVAYPTASAHSTAEKTEPYSR